MDKIIKKIVIAIDGFSSCGKSTFAKAIAARHEAKLEQPLNIIACENAVRASSQLKEHVLSHLNEEQKAYCNEWVGFPDCSVDRIVPPVRTENPIDVVVEAFYEWNVEEKSFVGEVPHIAGMNLADNLIAYIERKLFTLNTGHAITAYIGKLRGKATIDESIAERVRTLTSLLYDILRCHGIIRIDYIITEGNKLNLLEINTTPGMTATSFIPQQVRAAGLDIKEVLTEIIEESFA